MYRRIHATWALLGAAAIVPGAYGLADAVEESSLRCARWAYLTDNRCGESACRRCEIRHRVTPPRGADSHALEPRLFLGPRT